MLTVPMTILMFIQLSYFILLFFGASSFITRYREKGRIYNIYLMFICLSAMIEPLSAITGQILFNSSLNSFAGEIYRFINLSAALTIFFIWTLTVEIFELKKLKWTYPLFAFLSAWFLYLTLTVPFFLTFQNSMIQPILTPAVRSIYVSNVVLWTVEWIIFGVLALHKSLKGRPEIIKRSYSNFIPFVFFAVLSQILSAAYTYLNFNWLYIAAWLSSVFWAFALVLSFLVFKNEDESLIYNPFKFLQRHLSYKFAFSAFLAFFTLITLMAVLLGHSISSGLSQSLSVLGVSREVVVSLIGANQNLVVSIGLCSTVLLALFSYGVIRAQTRPFEKMVVDLRGMPPGQWTPLTGNFGKDEAGQLVQAFNRMVLTVKSQTAEILKNNESLMQGNAVADKRNEELMRANEILSEKKRELEEFEDAAIRRELYMVELKRQIEAKKARREL